MWQYSYNNSSLMHYGVKGQKWGVRNYQNEDGTLASLGKERYVGQHDYSKDESKGPIRRQAEKSHGMTRVYAEWREGRHKKNLAKAQQKGDAKKIEKYESKRDAQSAANRNLEAYQNHSSTAKLLLRNAMYEHARARGNNRLQSFMEALDPTGIMRMRRDKKAYGKYIVYAEMADNEYTANGLKDE